MAENTGCSLFGRFQYDDRQSHWFGDDMRDADAEAYLKGCADT